MAFDIVSYIMGSQINGGGGSGGGKAFKSLTLEEDGSYTVVDTKDNEHTIEVEEENGRIVELTYDGESVNLEYDGEGNLVMIGDSEVDVEDYPEPPSGGGYGGVAVIPIQSITEALPTNTTVTV